MAKAGIHHSRTTKYPQKIPKPRATGRRIFSLLLVLLLTFSFSALPALAAGQVSVDKSAGNTDYASRTSTVTLSVTGTPQDKPVDAVLVLDRSLSMQGTNITNLKTAAQLFVDKVIDDNANSRVGIVVYGSEATQLHGFSNNKTTLNNAITTLSLDGYTNMHDGMIKANAMLGQANPGSVKVVVFMSDGVPNRYINNGNVTGSGANFSTTARDRFITEANAAKAGGAVIYTIGLYAGLDNSEKNDARSALNPPAPDNFPSGYYETHDASTLDAIYDSIGNKVNIAGTGAVVTDIVPPEFEPVTGSYKVNGTTVDGSTSPYSVVYDAGTRTLTWTLGTIGNETLDLTYDVTAQPYHYGAIFTNSGAELSLTLEGTNGPSTHPFPDPYVLVRPYAQDDAYSAVAGVPSVVSAGDGVMDNDENHFLDDSSGDWTFSDLAVDTGTVTTPVHGTLTINADGSFTYTPDVGYSGTDSFTYRLFTTATDTETDDSMDLFSDVVTVTITVTAPPDPSPEPSESPSPEPSESPSPEPSESPSPEPSESPSPEPSESPSPEPSESPSPEPSESPSPEPSESPSPEPSESPSPEPSESPSPEPSASPSPPPDTPPRVPLIVNVVGPGTALPGSGAYSLNSIVAFTVTPDTGAVFLGWTGPDGGDVDANDRLLMSGAREVTANFEIPEPIPEGPPAETPAPEPEPTPEPEETMSEESVPEGAPDTESTGEEEIVTDLAVPLDTPELPQTSGIPLLLITGTGVASIAGGVVLKRRKRKHVD